MALEYSQHCDVYLKRNQDVVAHASRLFSAGAPRSVFAIDESAGLGKVEKVLLFPLLLAFRKQPNPYVSRFEQADHGRNKLMIFDSWVVRCTYQQYVADRGAELFYYSGTPINEIRSISCNPGNIEIYCEHGNLGGGMYTSEAECQRIFRAFEQLNASGKLSAGATVSRS